jgi:hypothetical protein
MSHTFLTKIFPSKLGFGIYMEIFVREKQHPQDKSSYPIDVQACDASIVCSETPAEIVSDCT